MKLIHFIAPCLFFVACRHENKNKDMLQYFDKEIRNRVGVIRAQPDSLQTDALKVERDVNNLALMLKDIENIVAATGRANRYFKLLAGEHGLNPADFAPLSPAMEPDELTALLKENELNFFNQTIFKMKPVNNLPVYTAH